MLEWWLDAQVNTPTGTGLPQARCLGLIDWEVQPYECFQAGLGTCFGTPGDCPCGFAEDPERGCGNSATPAGAVLSTNCTLPQVSSNGTDLRVAGSVPGQPGIFFQGDAISAGLPFGEGILCVGGQVQRLQVAVANEFG